MHFADPNEILAKYTIKETKASRRINPDNVQQFSNKVTYDNGITVYTVDDTEEGQAAVRSIIDTHWGADANPWCLAARDYDDELRPAWDYWHDTYNTVDKRIAFKNGKLLAFCASDDGSNTWWDREDNAHDGIPYTVKKNGSTIEYIYNETTAQSIKISESSPDGTLRTWFDNGFLKSETLPDGTNREWYSNRQLSREILPDNTEHEWYENGNKQSEKSPDGKEYSWYENGQQESEKLPDGTEHLWWSNGQLQYEILPDRSEHSWFENGQIAKEFLPDSTYRTWYQNGYQKYEKLPNGTVREWYGSGKIKSESLQDGTKREWFDNDSKNPKSETLPNGTIHRWYENGNLQYEYLRNGTEHTWYESGKIKSESLPDRWRNFTTREWYENGKLKYEQIPHKPEHYWDENGNLTDEDGNLLPDEISNEEVYNQTMNNRQEAVDYFKNYKAQHPDGFITPDALQRFDQLVTHSTGNIIWNNRFDLRYAGSSEGSAAFGFGAYFEQNPAVAQSYRRFGLPEGSEGIIHIFTNDGQEFTGMLRIILSCSQLSMTCIRPLSIIQTLIGIILRLP